MLRSAARLASRAIVNSQRRSLSAEAAEIPSAVDTAGRYATALYHAANKTKSMEAVSADVTRMQEMQSTIPTLDEFLLNPTLPRSAKLDALSEVIARSSFSPTFSQFLMVMAENGRTADAGKALEAFQNILSALKGEVICKVTTTTPLSEWEMALLKKKIKQRFFADKADAEVTVETAIDADLIGGLTIQVGDRFMDLSTRTELRKLQEVILKTA